MDVKPSEEVIKISNKSIESQDGLPKENPCSGEEKEKVSVQTETDETIEKPVSPSKDNESQKPVENEKPEIEIVPLPPPMPQLEHKRRIIVKHSILGNKIPSQ